MDERQTATQIYDEAWTKIEALIGNPQTTAQVFRCLTGQKAALSGQAGVPWDREPIPAQMERVFPRLG